MSKLITAGKENAINRDKIVAISEVDSAPIKRLIRNAREMGMLVDLTVGSKTRSAIVMESGHIILSLKTPDKFFEKNTEK